MGMGGGVGNEALSLHFTLVGGAGVLTANSDQMEDDGSAGSVDSQYHGGPVLTQAAVNQSQDKNGTMLHTWYFVRCSFYGFSVYVCSCMYGRATRRFHDPRLFN